MVGVIHATSVASPSQEPTAEEPHAFAWNLGRALAAMPGSGLESMDLWIEIKPARCGPIICINSVGITPRGTGAFRALLDGLESAWPGDVMVDSVVNGRLASYLDRRGYHRLARAGNLSFFRLPIPGAQQ